MNALREVAELVAVVKTGWRPDESDDAQGVADWRFERQLREARLTAAEQWGKPFDEALWFSETRAALLELAALAIAQVESLDRAAGDPR